LEDRLCFAGDRIFAADTLSSPGIVYEITTGRRVEFARVNSDGDVGDLAVSPDNRLLAVTAASHGSLWDITSGGDHTQDTPLARDLFPTARFVAGMAFDAQGNVYLGAVDSGRQPIAVVAPDGSVSYLPDASGNPALFDNTRGLAVVNNVLYIVEGGTGQPSFLTPIRSR
jgi:hypothetical protein